MNFHIKNAEANLKSKTSPNPHPTARLPWVWEATPYNGSLCVIRGGRRVKNHTNIGKYIRVGRRNYGHIGRSDVDNLMPATRPEIDQLN